MKINTTAFDSIQSFFVVDVYVVYWSPLYFNTKWQSVHKERVITTKLRFLSPSLKHPLHWRHNGCDGVSNHQPHDCLLSRLVMRRSQKTPKLCVTGFSRGNWPVNSPHKGPVTRKMFPFEDVIVHQVNTFAPRLNQNLCNTITHFVTLSRKMCWNGLSVHQMLLKKCSKAVHWQFFMCSHFHACFKLIWGILLVPTFSSHSISHNLAWLSLNCYQIAAEFSNVPPNMCNS